MMKRPVAPRPGRKSQPPRKLLQPVASQPPPAAVALESADAQAKRAALVSEALGAATGVGVNKYVAQRILSQFSGMLLHGTDPKTTLFLLAELRPGNILESLLITQMIGTHEAALGFLKTSTADDLGQWRDQNVSRSTRLMRLFMEQLEQLQRLRGTTRQQRVVVEHVNAGGQAIVDVVGPPPAALPAAEPAQKLLPLSRRRGG
jgi:hypothetical protein